MRRGGRPDAALALEIRDFVADDGPALLELARELQAWEGALHDRMRAPEEIGPWYLEALKSAARLNEGRLLVAAEGGRLVGYVLLLTEVSSGDQPDEVAYSYALVRDIVVAADRRRQGVGARLLARCEEIARASGAHWLRIAALARNEGALSLYERAGFTPLFITLEKPLEK